MNKNKRLILCCILIILVVVNVVSAGVIGDFFLGIWRSIFGTDEPFLVMVENFNDITDPYTTYQICKPNLDTKINEFDIKFTHVQGAIEYELYYNESVPDKMLTSFPVDVNKVEGCEKSIVTSKGWASCYGHNESLVWRKPFDSYNEVTNTISYNEPVNKFVYVDTVGEKWTEINKQDVKDILNNAEVGACYLLKVQGHKRANQKVRVDNIIKYDSPTGVREYTEWAWWNANWDNSQPATITNNDGANLIKKGHTVNVSMDTATLIDAGKMTSNCSDIRVVYKDTTSIEWTFVNRTFLSDFDGCNDAGSIIMFQTQANISAGGTDTDYIIYYDYASASQPNNNVSEIFIHYEDFRGIANGTDLNGAGGWACSASSAIYISNHSARRHESATNCTQPLDYGTVQDLTDFQWITSYERGLNIDGNPSYSLVLANGTRMNIGFDDRDGSNREIPQSWICSNTDISGQCSVGSEYKSDLFTIALTEENLYELNFFHRAGLDTDIIGWKNGTLLDWSSTNDTQPTMSNPAKVMLGYQRSGHAYKNILVQRLMPNYNSDPPTTALGSEVSGNTAPVINSNITSPIAPAKFDTVQIIANITDAEGADDIVEANFTLIAPNGTKVIDHINGTLAQSDNWSSLTYILGDNGTWIWTINVTDAGSATDNDYGSFLITTAVPTINSNGTIPVTPNYQDVVQIWANVTDADGADDIVTVNFTLIAPNTTKVIDNVNGSINGTNYWNSSTYIVEDFGTWTWTVNSSDGAVGDSDIGYFNITNSPPTIAELGGIINGTRSITNSVGLTCENSTDAEGHTIYYEFYGDTSNPPTTLLQNTTTKTYTWATDDGLTYLWRCRANDNYDAGAYSGIKQFSENNKSLVYLTNITSPVAYTNTSLVGWSIGLDTDNATFTVYMNWSNGATLYQSCTNESIADDETVYCSLPSGVQTKHETWNFNVTIWDGHELSAMNSTSINITNYLPDATKPTLSPTPVFSNTTGVNCSAQVFDGDGDPITINLTWWNGTTAYQSSSTILTDSDTASLVLTSGIQANKETWNCSARVEDDYEYATEWRSTFVDISNLAPTTPIQDAPANNSVYSGSATFNCSNSTDVDGDTIYYEFYINKTNPPTTLQQNGTQNNFTMNLSQGIYHWRCRANDQTNASSYTGVRTVSDVSSAVTVNEICPTGLTQAMYYDFKRESNLTHVNASVDYNLKFNLGGTGDHTASGTIANVGNFSICMNTSAVSDYNIVYGEFLYYLDEYTSRRYYLFEGERVNVTLINDTLMLLSNGDATSFLFEFLSTSLTPYENIYASILRWYPALDTYDTVEMAKTDNKGQTIMRVKTEDTDYRVGVYETDGTLIKLFDAIRFACLTSPCSYTSLIEETETDYTSIYDVQATLDYLHDGVFQVVYSDSSQITTGMNLSVYKETGLSQTLICATGAYGFTGVLNCNVSAYTGSLRAIVYRSASPGQVILQKWIQTATTAFTGRIGLFVGFISFITLAFMGIGSPVLVLLFGLIGLVPALIFKSITLTVFIGLGVLGGLLLHFMKRSS